MDTFKCTKCGKTKPISCFSIRNAIKRGHRSTCKLCDNQYYNNNRDRLVEAKREYNKRPEVIARNKELYIKYASTIVKQRPKIKSRKWSSSKYYASVNAAVYRAKKRGLLIKPKTCEQCGITTNILQAHHSDYSKPLEVVWLCIKCHSLTRKIKI